MARALSRLSDRRARTLPPGLHADGGGLYLQVTPSGRSWIFRFATGEVATSRNGKPRRVERAMGLGSFPDTSLAEAREKAASARKLRAEHKDPIEARDAVRASLPAPMTFAAVAADYLAVNGPAFSAAHRQQWQTSLTQYAFPIIGNMPVAAVTTETVYGVLAPIWLAKPETARRLRGRIEAVLGAAIARGLRTGANPATYRGNLSHILPKKSKVQRVTHHAAMPYAELPGFMTTLRARTGPAAKALELLILTAARTGEVLGARWAEIDVAAALWTIPESRMKARRDHRVPLSGAALAVLAALPRNGPFVFPAERRAGAMHDEALAETLERMGVGVTVHGFRSTFRDWAAEQTDFANHVVEMSLAHTIRNQVEAAYRRGDMLDKRRELMDEWGKFCGS
jgi:integrase